MKAARTVALLSLLAVTAVALHHAETLGAAQGTTELRTDMTDRDFAGTPTPDRPAKSAGRASARSVSQLADAVTEISISVDRLHNLVVIALGVSVINIVVNALALLSWRRRRSAGESTQDDVGKDVPRTEPSPAGPRPPTDHPSPVPSLQDDLPSPLGGRLAPPTGPVEKTEKPQPSPAPTEPDEFAGLPHAAMGRALSRLHRALPDLARKIPDPRQQERFLAELDLPLKARVEHFKEAMRRGDAYLKEHWIEQDLVTTLNTLAQMLSSVIEERYRARRGNRALEDELLSWLYEQLAPVCRAEGWFAVESILPFTTKFDPKIHHSVGSVELQGADNLIVAIKAIGRRDARQGFVTHKAEVLVGR